MEFIYDQYAAAALQALISKLPLLDREGSLGDNITEEELEKTKRQLVRSAHEYAMYMIQERPKYVDYLTHTIPEFKQEVINS